MPRPISCWLAAVLYMAYGGRCGTRGTLSFGSDPNDTPFYKVLGEPSGDHDTVCCKTLCIMTTVSPPTSILVPPPFVRSTKGGCACWPRASPNREPEICRAGRIWPTGPKVATKKRMNVDKRTIAAEPPSLWPGRSRQFDSGPGRQLEPRACHQRKGRKQRGRRMRALQEATLHGRARSGAGRVQGYVGVLDTTPDPQPCRTG